MLPQIMKEDRGKEKTEDESREQKINAYGPENLNQKKKVRSQDEFEASGKGVLKERHLTFKIQR